MAIGFVAPMNTLCHGSRDTREMSESWDFLCHPMPWRLMKQRVSSLCEERRRTRCRRSWRTEKSTEIGVRLFEGDKQNVGGAW